MSDAPSPLRSGLLVAAPSSGSGKTLVTLALLRSLRRRGVSVRAAKAGPDYIDPAFHAAALGRPSLNLDPWCMRPELLAGLAGGSGEPLVVEGMMGLFDGAADGSGSAADLAQVLALPVVLVVDCARQSHSVAALVRGFRDHRPGLTLAALVLNRVGSPRHERMLREALLSLGIPVLACLPALPDLLMPSRHLGLVQAGEHGDLHAFLGRAADWWEAGVDPAALEQLLRSAAPSDAPAIATLAPLGQRIAVARDVAFAFSYPHLLQGWRAAGAEISFFSPLGDESPEPAADAVFLPGGYPELHAGALAAASGFHAGMRAARDRGALIYGECGGFMALGTLLVDGEGTAHRMLGLLDVETSFARPRRHLGYRRIAPRPGNPLPWTGPLRGHEFHYATVLRESGEPLFDASDALGADRAPAGLHRGRVAGSFLHLVDREAA